MQADEGLRDRLIRVGGELLDDESLSAMSLREIARRGSLTLATGATDPGALLDAALTAHLGPVG